jgi:hypothetical protein
MDFYNPQKRVSFETLKVAKANLKRIVYYNSSSKILVEEYFFGFIKAHLEKLGAVWLLN